MKTDKHTCYPEYTDVREDRVIIYGSTYNDKIQKFTYQIKATNVGTYSIPPAFGEAMYDRDIQAVSTSGQKISIISQQ
ncbi:alpha-2-macroglobulin family protein [Gilliamella sp. ESL0250]|uniref:alpha-2-macroglobulin family protein n=1 Tax=Gilliamella sp. ESL0250 TaxID=2705036 RepID=UPI00406C58AD